MKRGLGRGLDALIGETLSDETRVEEIPLSEIDPNPGQPRRAMDGEKLEQLAESIRSVGVIQPITVRREGMRYTIIAGERRWRASRLAGLRAVPCIVRDADETLRLEMALIENLQRDDLNPIDEAFAIQELMANCGLTQEAVAGRLGKSRPAVANLLRLLGLPPLVQEMIVSGALSEGHGRALAGIEDPQMMETLARRAVENAWSVRQMEEARRALLAAPREKGRAERETPVEFAEFETRLRERLGTKVKISGTTKKGRITIQYFSQEDLERVYEALGMGEG